MALSSVPPVGVADTWQANLLGLQPRIPGGFLKAGTAPKAVSGSSSVQDLLSRITIGGVFEQREALWLTMLTNAHIRPAIVRFLTVRITAALTATMRVAQQSWSATAATRLR
jgi:hypothetical protein